MTIYAYLFICAMTFLAGLIDSIAGGGGLISLPAYLALGLPAHLAGGTNKCSAVLGTIVSTARYMKQGRVRLYSAIGAAIAALIGSTVGARMNLLLNDNILHIVMIVAVPAIAILLAFQKNFGSEEKHVENSKGAIIGVAIGFVLGMYDGFFGPGTGTFLVLAFTAFLGMDLVTATGNAKIVNLCSGMAAFVTFALNGQVLWSVALPAAVTGICGNYLGSGLALKKGAKLVRAMLYVVLGILTIKLIVDMF